MDKCSRRQRRFKCNRNPTHEDKKVGDQDKYIMARLKQGLGYVDTLQDMVLTETDLDWVENVEMAGQENIVRRLRLFWKELSQEDFVNIKSNFITKEQLMEEEWMVVDKEIRMTYLVDGW